MFYCDPCGENAGWPTTKVKSRGSCEVCCAVSLCNDLPNHLLKVTTNGSYLDQYKRARDTKHHAWHSKAQHPATCGAWCKELCEMMQLICPHIRQMHWHERFQSWITRLNRAR